MFDSYINNPLGGLLYIVLYGGPSCEPGVWVPLDVALLVVGGLTYRMQTRAMQRRWSKMSIGVRWPVVVLSVGILLFSIVFGVVELQNTYPDVLAIPFETCRF
jgi:hypothetical protein